MKYRGRTFHVQTEDSRSTIVTLVYEGGSILHSCKTRYGDDAGGADEAQVRMEEQHRDIVLQLKSGAIDADLGIEPETPSEPVEVDAPTGRVSAPEEAPTQSGIENGASAEPVECEAGESDESQASVDAPEATQCEAEPRSEPLAHLTDGVATGRRLDEIVLDHLALRAARASG